MFTYKTADQLIIGLKSLHPIFRMIKESDFKTITLFSDLHQSKIDTKYINMIERFSNKNHLQFNHINTDNNHSFHTVNQNNGLFISVGKYYIHNIARLSNVNKLAHYTIDTSFGKVSGYGDNVYWQNSLIKYNEEKPQIVFNPCEYIKYFQLEDAIYFLHEIHLALDVFVHSQENDFINALAINGICGVLKNINIVRTNKLNKKQLSRVACEIAQADTLMKYAFNNIEFKHTIKTIAEDCDNFDDFMETLAYSSKSFFNECLKTNSQLFETSCKFNNYSFKRIVEDFNELYRWFQSHAKPRVK